MKTVHRRLSELETYQPEPELSPDHAQRIRQRIAAEFTPATQELIKAGDFAGMSDDALVRLDAILRDRLSVQYPNQPTL